MSSSNSTALPVRIEKLTKYYGSFCAVDAASFDIAPGELRLYQDGVRVRWQV